MNKTKYLLVFALPFVFITGCIDGQAVINLNKNGSGKVTFEGLFDYASYSKTKDMLPSQSEAFFLGQIKEMITSGSFTAWNDVHWKLLGGGRCYFKGTAYFQDINKTDFYAGSFNSNLKIVWTNGDKPTLELKYAPGGQLPPALLSALNVSLIITLPAEIEETEHFKLLDSQTAMLAIQGGNLSQTSGKLVFAPDGNDLFDYRSQVSRAQKEYEKTLQDIDDRLKTLNSAENAEKLESQTLDFKMRQGLIAESQKKFDEALNIYANIISDPNADEKFRAAANYQTSVCFLQMGEREKAEKQFEYVINNFPLQRNAALKSVKMLRDIRLGNAGINQQDQKQIPSVVSTIPELYTQDVDPNIRSITITFSEPMKKTDWFYSSFKEGWIPEANGLPFFDPCGLEWTLPVRLQPGKVYAIALNYSDSEISNLKSQISNTQTGFRSVSGQQCEKFVLLFATASAGPRSEAGETSPEGGDANQQPTDIDDGIIGECEKINFKQ
ncbi:MAG: hypothetical protein ABSE89_00995 [Sedimentisphaerales bacterium]